MRKFWALYGVINVFFLSLAIIFGFAGQIAAAPGETAPDEQVVFSRASGAPDPQVVFNEVNARRKQGELVQLRPNQKLADLAASRASDLAQRRYYAHKNPDGKYYFDYFETFNIRSGYSCENLDLVFVPDETRVVEEWLTSLKGHRGCLLNTKVNSAGYAGAKITFVQFDGTTTDAYVVVAIHANLLDPVVATSR